ncbi:hypothetical protein QSV08_04120 [Maribacter sp. BPC-D8]|uniref:hypothetical protein n=1 Tax=Maribacter sp. BPC-D8 TaxID=3053613 RepID=UPI002B48FE96|nr:hypothetical protein [Maribacter sp. BPC-D8]WRI30430.1 hypothetical protein QSV08_04120 [Maribacter sp. BPC-D8]
MILLPALALLSCGQNSFEKKLNGKWYGRENDGFTRFYFYPDSLISMEWNTQNVKWTANESKIEFDYIEQWPYQTFIKDTTAMILEYALSDNNNTLSFIKVKDSNMGRNFNLIRADNYFEFLSKISGVPFKLPYDNKIQRIKLEGSYGLKFFIENTNGKTTIVSEFGNGMDYINKDVINFKRNLQPLDRYHQRKLESEIHFRIFADKSISDEEIEKLIQKIPESEVKKVFRIYESENYYNFETLAGKPIKTIANKK